jgi:DNA-binding MarR family transcriptional regulator
VLPFVPVPPVHQPHDERRPLTPEPGEPGESALDESAAELFRAFRRAAQLHRRFLGARLAACDVHPGQAACLGVLAHHDGRSQRELAQAMHVAPPTLSRMLRSMEAAGLVERRSDQADQRRTRVYLTEGGRRAAAELRSALAGHLPAAIHALTPGERRELARLLDKLSASLAATLDGPDAGAGA